MGLLTKLFQESPTVQKLPAGAFTVDHRGEVIFSTVPSSCDLRVLQSLGAELVKLLREAREAQTPLAELNLVYGSLLVTARELSSGAIIFLTPQTGAPAPLPETPASL